MDDFKIGEFAKVRDLKNCSHYFPIGTIVEIVDIKNDKLICFGLIRCEKYHFDTQSVLIDEIEKIKTS